LGRPQWGAHSAAPDLLAGFRGGEGKVEGKTREGENGGVGEFSFPYLLGVRRH